MALFRREVYIQVIYLSSVDENVKITSTKCCYLTFFKTILERGSDNLNFPNAGKFKSMSRQSQNVLELVSLISSRRFC
jgi:hypothetical protein